MDAPEPETPFAAVTAQTSKAQRVCWRDCGGLRHCRGSVNKGNIADVLASYTNLISTSLPLSSHTGGQVQEYCSYYSACG